MAVRTIGAEAARTRYWRTEFSPQRGRGELELHGEAARVALEGLDPAEDTLVAVERPLVALDLWTGRLAAVTWYGDDHCKIELDQVGTAAGFIPQAWVDAAEAAVAEQAKILARMRAPSDTGGLRRIIRGY